MTSSSHQTQSAELRITGGIALVLAGAAAKEDGSPQPRSLDDLEEAGREYYLRLARAVVQALPPATILSEPLIEIGETSRGYKIYRQTNGAGGHTYWSDAIGDGVIVYDSCLASEEEVMIALKADKDMQP